MSVGCLCLQLVVCVCSWLVGCQQLIGGVISWLVVSVSYCPSAFVVVQKVYHVHTATAGLATNRAWRWRPPPPTHTRRQSASRTITLAHTVCHDASIALMLLRPLATAPPSRAPPPHRPADRTPSALSGPSASGLPHTPGFRAFYPHARIPTRGSGRSTHMHVSLPGVQGVLRVHTHRLPYHVSLPGRGSRAS